MANSPLVKAALHGGDPNWGRIAQAVGAALPDTAPLALDIFIEDVQVCAAGMAIPFDLPTLAEAVAGEEVEYDVVLPGDGAEAEVFFSDLSHEYVTINADYTTVSRMPATSPVTTSGTPSSRRSRTSGSSTARRSSSSTAGRR